VNAAIPPSHEVVIVAYGFEYLIMAINNARSIRRTNPGLTVTLVTNLPRTWTALEEDFDRVVFTDDPTEQNRLAKIRCPDVSRADRVLYLDADSEVHGDLSPAFDLLEHYDVLLRPFELPSKFGFELVPGLDARHYTMFMGCVLFFRRSEAALELFRRWEDRFTRSGLRRDQPALARAVLDTPSARILPLNAVWGALGHLGTGPSNWPGRIPPRIYHYADVSNDADVLSRCREALDDLVPRLPGGADLLPDVAATKRRFDRLASPWYRNRATNRLARRWWRYQDRRRDGAGDDTRKKRPEAAGNVLGFENERLWTD